MTMKTAKERFDEKWEPITETGCWIWTGAHGRYGTFWLGKEFNNGRMVRSHFASLNLYKGVKESDAKYICHKCDTPLCVNPEHLFIADHKINMRDCVTKKRNTYPRQKLNEKDVEYAKKLKESGMFVKDVAKAIGISPSHCSRILRDFRTYFNPK